MACAVGYHSSMPLAWIAAALLAQAADPWLDKVKEGVAFPPAAEVEKAAAKSKWHRQVLDLVLDPRHWAASLKELEARSGLSAPKLEIQVRFAALPPGRPARAAGAAGKGHVELDIDRLAKNEESVADFDRLKAAGVTVLVPPARTRHVVPHELVHCFQAAPQPDWVLEGMASWIGRDPNHVLAFRHAGVRVAPVGEALAAEWIYARGWAFFEWVETVHGADKAKKLVALLVEGRAPAEAATEVLGRPWEELRKAERDASAKWISKYK